jgi:hypothetical protein
MFRIQVSVPAEVVETLYELAQQELRTPVDQASWLLMEAVKRRQQRAQRCRAPQREQEVLRAAG